MRQKLSKTQNSCDLVNLKLSTKPLKQEEDISIKKEKKISLNKFSVCVHVSICMHLINLVNQKKKKEPKERIR